MKFAGTATATVQCAVHGKGALGIQNRSDQCTQSRLGEFCRTGDQIGF